MFTRTRLHEAIDEVLDSWEIGENIPLSFGGIEIIVNHGKERVRVKWRETEVPFEKSRGGAIGSSSGS